MLADGSRHRLRIGLPGQFNRANAAMVAVAALPLLEGTGGERDGADRGQRPGPALGRHRGGGTVLHGPPGWEPVRLLLAKNPAGWTAIFDLLEETGDANAPLVLSVNARVADGLDPSWLWDVPFERLAGRAVVATGDRRLDLAVRLRYAEVAHEVVARPIEAVDRAARRGRDGHGRVPRQLHRVRRPPAGAVTGRVGRTLTVAVVYPDLLGTYGDGGNGLVLARRAAWRGIDVELVQAPSERPLPMADLYTHRRGGGRAPGAGGDHPARGRHPGRPSAAGRWSWRSAPGSS